MHILLVNDDGPPSPETSPFVLALSQALQSAGHTISVILPNQQRSWIGKAHIIDTIVTATPFCPTPVHRHESNAAHVPPDNICGEKSWILANSTPAGCVHLGIYHCFQDRVPIDLVVSGPNLGRNSTTVFSLSSGTIGAAMEAAICGKRAIALSFAVKTDNFDSAAIYEASTHSVRLIEHLYNIWADDVDLYSINVPLEVRVSMQKIMYTSISKRQWPSGGAFCAKSEGQRSVNGRNEHMQFQWAPQLHTIRDAAKGKGPGNDDWVIEQGMTR
ncbi:hypothetical protein AtubIFM54640_006155 [Aspergillus tubingensis]|nr:hypothetical protein AtubIFM54640_006155 [Aspergillus tubingensis]